MATMYVYNIPTDETVNLRSSRSTTTSNVLVRVPYGAAVSASAYDSTWHNATYSGYSGYIQSQYLTTSNPGSGGSGGTATAGKIDGSNVNVRPDPSTNNPAKKVVNTGDKVTYYDGKTYSGSGYTWFRCTSSLWSGDGYIVTKYVVPDGGSTVPGVVGTGPNSAVTAAMIRVGNGLWKIDLKTTHPQIKILQSYLNKWTIEMRWSDINEISEDGVFGNNTDFVVKKYQQLCINPTVSIDGLVGQYTLKHLEEDYGAIK